MAGAQLPFMVNIHAYASNPIFVSVLFIGFLLVLSIATGNKTQQERDYVLNSFRNGRQSILVATDVAARGLGKSFCGQCIG